MLDEINSETVRILFNIQIATKEEIEKIEKDNLKNAEKNLELKRMKIHLRLLKFLKNIIKLNKSQHQKRLEGMSL